MSDNTLIDIAALTAPLSDAAPCGDNLEYDPQFQALEQAARGKPEVEYGSTLTPATPPDWIEVRMLALQLMERCRDLRIAMTLTRALLKLEGVPGLAAGLTLLAELLTRQWDHVHPQLDPDDGNDPMLRVNVLAALCQSSALLRDLRDAPLAQVRAVGSVSLRDIEQAAGERESEDDGRKSMRDAVFSAAAQEQLAQMVSALEHALAITQRIEQELTARVGVGSALDLEPLATVLRRAADAVRPHLRA
ncbi:type VI secretion system protein TssA, partial [Duganella callida]